MEVEVGVDMDLVEVPASIHEGLGGDTAAGDAGVQPCRVEVLAEQVEEEVKY